MATVENISLLLQSDQQSSTLNKLLNVSHEGILGEHSPRLNDLNGKSELKEQYTSNEFNESIEDDTGTENNAFKRNIHGLKLQIHADKPLNSLRCTDHINEAKFLEVQNHENDSPSRENNAAKPKPRVLMGKSALMTLQSKDFDSSSSEYSAVIHDLVLNKYDERIKNYCFRSLQRRISRDRWRNDDSLSSCYTPRSLSSIETPGFDFTESNNNRFLYTCGCNNEENSTSLETSPSSSEKYSCLVFNRDFFLNVALGNDLNITSSTDNFRNQLYDRDNDHSKSVDTANLSTLISYEQRHDKKCEEEPVSSSQHSRTSTVSLRNEAFKDNAIFIDLSGEVNQNKLLELLGVQESSIIQAINASSVCRHSPKFYGSIQHIEAERILLKATLTRKAIKQQLANLESKREMKTNNRSFGFVQISDIRFPTKESLTDSDVQLKVFDEYFVVVLSCGTQVVTSEILKIQDGKEIVSNKTFLFKNLNSDFCISIEIYALKLQARSSNFKSRSMQRAIKCPSPKTIFHLGRRPSDLDVSSSQQDMSFVLCGGSDIRSTDLDKQMVFKKPNAHNHPMLRGTFNANIVADVVIDVRMVGFLSIGKETGSGALLWNRRWCILEGSKLKCWNYPSEETNDPVQTIDLADCLNQTIKIADRSVCPRPKNLLLTVQEDKCPVINFFLSADTTVLTDNWQVELNCALNALRSWNVMRTYKNRDIVTPL